MRAGAKQSGLSLFCTEDYRMLVPSMCFDVASPTEVDEIVFGQLNDIGARQELLDIIEFGSNVTYYLHIANKDEEILDIVEIFKINDKVQVEEIWAL